MASCVNESSWLLQIPQDVFMQGICRWFSTETFGILAKVCKAFQKFIWNPDYSVKTFLNNHRLFLTNYCLGKIIFDVKKNMTFIVEDRAWYASLKDPSWYHLCIDIRLLLQLREDSSKKSDQSNDVLEKIRQQIELKYDQFVLIRALGEVSI